MAKRKVSKKTTHSRKLSRQEVNKHLPLLRAILRIGNIPQRRSLLSAAGVGMVDAASSVARNVLSGNIKVRKPAVRKVIFGKRRKEMEKMASLSTPRSMKLDMLRSGQKGGFFKELMAGLTTVAVPVMMGLASGAGRRKTI